jgi:hypothetical protein
MSRHFFRWPSLLILCSFFLLLPNQSRAQDSVRVGDAEFILSAGSSVVSGSSGTSLQNELMYHYTDKFSASIQLTYTRLHNELDTPVWLIDGTVPASIKDEAKHRSLVSLNLNGYYLPIQYKGHRLSVGGGLGYYVQTKTQMQLKGEANPPSIYLYDQTSRGLGFQLAARYAYRFTEKVSGGLSSHALFFDDTVFNLSLSLIYHL